LAPRPSKSESVSADEVSVSAGAFAPPADRFFDILQRVGGIERSVTYLEAQGQKIDEKLDKLAHEMTAAKATFSTVKYLAIGIFVGIWGLFSALAIAWAIHHLHWGNG
jgi:hypothetical protein